MIDPRVSLAGLVVGIFVGLSGVGGSAILAPVLILLLGVKPSMAIATDLLYSVPTKLFALALHARRDTIDWAITRRLLLGGIPGTAVGLTAIGVLRARMRPDVLETMLRHAVGTVILSATAIAVVTFVFRRQRASARADSAAAVIAIGAVTGTLVSMTSIGSGSVTLPLLIMALPGVALRRLIGSEIGLAAFLVPLAAAGHVSLGEANVRVAVELAAGAIPGVWIGMRLCTFFGDVCLRPIVVGLLAIAGFRLI